MDQVCGSSEPSGDVARGPASGGAVEIIADDKANKPNTLELTSGETVTVEIRNEDDMPHDFAIEKFDLNTGTMPTRPSSRFPSSIATLGTQFPKSPAQRREPDKCTLSGHRRGTLRANVESVLEGKDTGETSRPTTMDLPAFSCVTPAGILAISTSHPGACGQQSGEGHSGPRRWCTGSESRHRDS
jgi:hypothetical protein